MEEKRPSYVEQIPRVDWEKTLFQCPETGRGDGAANRSSREKQLAEVLTGEEQLLEKANRPDKNSSSPQACRPTRIWVEAGKKQSFTKNGEGREKGGQNWTILEKTNHTHLKNTRTFPDMVRFFAPSL